MLFIFVLVRLHDFLLLDVVERFLTVYDQLNQVVLEGLLLVPARLDLVGGVHRKPRFHGSIYVEGELTALLHSLEQGVFVTEHL